MVCSMYSPILNLYSSSHERQLLISETLIRGAAVPNNRLLPDKTDDGLMLTYAVAAIVLIGASAGTL